MHAVIECYRLFWMQNTQVALFYHVGALVLAAMIALEVRAERKAARWNRPR